MNHKSKRVWALSGLFWLGMGVLVGAQATGCGAVPEGSMEEPIAETKERVVTTITTLSQLRSMPLNCTCVLGANINAIATQTAGQEFIPVGTFFVPFEGSFDGAGYTISNLKIATGLVSTGLFGATRNAVIQRAALTNVTVTGRGITGGLVGSAAGTTQITESYVTGTVTGATSGSSLWSDHGMLVGSAWGPTIIARSYATGTVNGAIQTAGGLIGSSNGNSNSVTVEECFTNVTLTTNAAASSTIIRFGGLIGRVNGTNINHVHTAGSQTARSPAYVGGIVGEAEGGISGIPESIIRSAFSRGAVTIPASPAVDRAGAIGKHNNMWAWCGAMWDSSVDPGTPRPDSTACQSGVTTAALRSAYTNHGPFIFGVQLTDPAVPSYPGGSDGYFDLLVWNHNSASQHTTLKSIPDSVQPK